MTKKKLVNINKTSKRNLLAAVAVAVAVGIVGFTLYSTLAAGVVANIEAEQGTVSGNASKVADENASGGSFLQFGLASDGPPGDGGGDDSTRAAVRYNWGEPHSVSDEFNYGSPENPVPVDSSKWGTPPGCFAGHAGNGQRCAKNSRVNGSAMVMTGQANGDTGWLRQNLETQYGRWEIRSKSYNTGTSGPTYHALHLIWPSSERWPQDGEYDWVEYTDPNAQCLSSFIHYPHPNMPVQQEYAEKCPVDMTKWHNFAFEWTPDHVKGFVDGEEWFSYSGGAGPGGRGCIQCMPSGHLNIQLDNFHGSGLRPAKFEVDWVRFYPL